MDTSDNKWRPCMARLVMPDGQQKCGHPRSGFTNKFVTPEICAACQTPVGDILPLPSLPSRLSNAAKAAKVAMLDPTPASAEEVSRRESICNGCQFNQGRTCSVCGCNLWAKQRLKAFECPMGLWEHKPGDGV